jgi:hypothetical protein
MPQFQAKKEATICSREAKKNPEGAKGLPVAISRDVFPQLLGVHTSDVFPWSLVSVRRGGLHHVGIAADIDAGSVGMHPLPLLTGPQRHQRI